jgi:hypothetical protein
MRLIKHLKEEHNPNIWNEVYGMLEKDCSQILKAMQHTHNALWRGTKNTGKEIVLKTPRMDRRPKDTPEALHGWLDVSFHEKFGWYVRTEGVFATASKSLADEFGKPYMFFPFNGYEFVWSEVVQDLTNDIEDYKRGSQIQDFEIEEFVQQYTNKDIHAAIWSMNEISFKCDKYYLVDEDFWYQGDFHQYIGR